MKTIRIIDLLNKIANNEEMPKKIKYKKLIYVYEEGAYGWSYYIQNSGIKFLLTDIFNSIDGILNILNDEVEIIEENKIPEKLGKIEDNDGYMDQSDVIKIGEKIDEIIDYLEKKSKEKGE